MFVCVCVCVDVGVVWCGVFVCFERYIKQVGLQFRLAGILDYNRDGEMECVWCDSSSLPGSVGPAQTGRESAATIFLLF